MKINDLVCSILHLQTQEIFKMTRITVAKGDGIGPEIMDATLKIIFAAKLEIEVGEKVYLAVNTSGIASDAWNTITNKSTTIKI